MGLFIGIIVVLIILCTGFGVVGAVIGARMEDKNVGAGLVETDMRAGISASVLGGMLGILPFLVFIFALLITDATTDHGPSVQEEAHESTRIAAERAAADEAAGRH